jgi:hypothetical protein
VTSFFSTLGVRWRNTREMPSLLRMFCQGGMTAGPLLFIAFALPMGNIGVNGRTMSYGEFWSSGAGAGTELFLLMVTIGFWGLAARAPSSRWVLVVCPLISWIPIAFAVPNTLAESVPMLILESIVSAAFTYFCLFRLRSVRRYMEGGPRSPRARV